MYINISTYICIKRCVKKGCVIQTFNYVTNNNTTTPIALYNYLLNWNMNNSNN